MPGELDLPLDGFSGDLLNDRIWLEWLSLGLAERKELFDRKADAEGAGERLRVGEAGRMAGDDRLGAERYELLENPLLREKLLAVRALERLPPPPKLPPLERLPPPPPPRPPLLRPLGPFAKIAAGSTNSRKNARAAVSWANDVVNDESTDRRLKNAAFMSEIPGLDAQRAPDETVLDSSIIHSRSF